MSLKDDRQRVRSASVNLIARRQKLKLKTEDLSDRFERWRPTLLVGGGFVAGLLMGRGRLRDVTRSVHSTASFGWSLIRSSAGSMLVARILQSRTRPDELHAAEPETRL